MSFYWRERLKQSPDAHLIHLSEFFVIVLIGVAFEATIEPIGESMRAGKLWSSVPLLLTFVMTTFRFLVGNYRHLNNEKILSGPRFVLLFDMFWIGIESLVMIFLGSFTSIEQNEKALEHGHHYNYLTLLIALAAIDLSWILLRHLLFVWTKVEKKLRGWQLDWVAINVLIIGFGIGVWCGGYTAKLLTDGFLWTFFVLNLAIFLVDILGVFDFSSRPGVRPSNA